MKKYRVNESELFNLDSMREHLLVLRDMMREDTIPYQDDIEDRIEYVESLMDKAYCVGALVDWNTLKRIREIQSERQMIRYQNSLAAGSTERDAAMAFQL